MEASERRYELDWLRVTAIFLVFLFHSARFFDPTDWHVKNPVTYSELELPALFVVSWIMPLIFVISGASVFYAAGKSGSGNFLQGKVFRLLVPLVVGIFTHLPLQVYLERVTHRQFYGTFWEFLPHYFDGVYGWGRGNFAIMGMHLWYLLLLFLFTVLLAPLFRWLRRGSGALFLARLGNLLALPGVLYLPAPIIALTLNLLNPHKGIGAINLGGWPALIYLLFYLAGFLLYAHAGVINRVRHYRWLSLALGSLCLGPIVQQVGASGIPLWGTDRYQTLSLVYALCSWSWVLAFLGFFQQHLAFSTPFLRYANEAVLPFYVLHQTVLLCVGYFLIPLTLGDGLTYLLIVTSSLALILLLYEFVVRRFNLFRFLFGMKRLPKRVAQAEPALIGG